MAKRNATDANYFFSPTLIRMTAVASPLKPVRSRLVASAAARTGGGAHGDRYIPQRASLQTLKARHHLDVAEATSHSNANTSSFVLPSGDADVTNTSGNGLPVMSADPMLNLTASSAVMNTFGFARQSSTTNGRAVGEATSNGTSANVSWNPDAPTTSLAEATGSSASPYSTYQCLLRNELLGDEIRGVREEDRRVLASARSRLNARSVLAFRRGACTPTHRRRAGVGSSIVINDQNEGVLTPRSAARDGSGTVNSMFDATTGDDEYELAGEPEQPDAAAAAVALTSGSSALSPASIALLRSPRRAPRRVARTPYKVLDAPELQDDFYLNLVDWSAANLLAVGLDKCVYLWNAANSQVTKLCDLGATPSGASATAGATELVTSVSWSPDGSQLAVGTYRGIVQLYDARELKLVSELSGHAGRVGTLAWNTRDTLTSGSRDRRILHRDIRMPDDEAAARTLSAHRQEVCGLKWRPDDRVHLASGGNDNRLLIWDVRGGSTAPEQTYTQHTAAVKALDWSPHEHGLLASGGGTADRCVRFWNTLTGALVRTVDSGSQVCNLAWSRHAPELVSTHGYSQNHVLVWKYPACAPLARLAGHSMRVLYLALSPDSESIVTGAGDETLRFWRVFERPAPAYRRRSAFDPFFAMR